MRAFPGVLQRPAHGIAFATCTICYMPDSALNAYLRVAKLLLADAERELPPRAWRTLREILLVALQERVRRSRRRAA
jgi:hypothetical protein